GCHLGVAQCEGICAAEVKTGMDVSSDSGAPDQSHDPARIPQFSMLTKNGSSGRPDVSVTDPLISAVNCCTTSWTLVRSSPSMTATSRSETSGPSATGGSTERFQSPPNTVKSKTP